MQNPTPKTPVTKCLDLAAHAVRMFGKFPGTAGLAPLAAKLTASAQALDESQAKYTAAVKAILPTRVDVKYENFVSDRRIRVTQQKAELADGKKGGAIASQAFPEGSTPLVRLVGMSQVEQMVNLEGRLAALAPLWPDATAEAKAIGQHHLSYKMAIDGRTSAGQVATNLRAVRDVTKERFLTTYAEITSRVSAEFPRDALMQDLFFDDVRSRSAAEQADDSAAETHAEGETKTS
jgi:hypothetical protein